MKLFCGFESLGEMKKRWGKLSGLNGRKKDPAQWSVIPGVMTGKCHNGYWIVGHFVRVVSFKNDNSTNLGTMSYFSSKKCFNLVQFFFPGEKAWDFNNNEKCKGEPIRTQLKELRMRKSAKHPVRKACDILSIRNAISTYVSCLRIHSKQ